MKTEYIAFKEGATFRVECFRPHMVALLSILLATAPETTDGRMVVTEGRRDPRHPDDAHTWCNAFDIRSRNVIAQDFANREAAMWAWIGRARERAAKLGYTTFQFDAHGEGMALHIHAEDDPR